MKIAIVSAPVLQFHCLAACADHLRAGGAIRHVSWEPGDYLRYITLHSTTKIPAHYFHPGKGDKEIYLMTTSLIRKLRPDTWQIL